MNLIRPLLTAILAAAILPAQAKKESKQPVVNDLTTPLHLLQPAYKTPYGIPSESDITAQMESILDFLEAGTPCCVVDGKSGKAMTDYSLIDSTSRLQQGLFRLTSYEWGVTYIAMLSAGEVTGNRRFTDYTLDRLRFLSDVAPHFKDAMENGSCWDGQLKKMLQPSALDDCGAMCCAMLKAMRQGGFMPRPDMGGNRPDMGNRPANMPNMPGQPVAEMPKRPASSLQPIIDNYMTWIMDRQYRLQDGTLARNRPVKNAVWLDDMFMSLPAMAQMGTLTRDKKYFDEACKQYRLFVEKMFVPEQKLFRHGWVESMSFHPSMFWARANGWAILTTVELLDALPENHHFRPFLLQTLESHIQGLLALQSGEGFWHQLLDRNDSYLETSATAIYCYAISHAINKGWIDAQTYGPSALLAWNAVSTKITAEGHVEGTCVGTGMAFDPAFYYYRPVNDYAAHGYGPTLLAGTEIIRLLRTTHPKMNDSAVMFYPYEITSKSPIFEDTPANRQSGQSAGSSRKPGRPVVFTIGDSTVKNGSGTGSDGLWGWGAFLGNFLNTDSVTVENYARGGRSSRTFIDEGLWDDVLKGIQPGDYVILQFGHNDGGRMGDGRNRFTLRGNGDETQAFPIGKDGADMDVHTYGWYIRKYIDEAVAKGATPIVCSLIPRAMWDKDGKIIRATNDYTAWAREAAASSDKAFFIDLNALVADKYDALGKSYVNSMFPKDHTHTNHAGAILNAATIAEAVKSLPIPLASYVNPVIQK